VAARRLVEGKLRTVGLEAAQDRPSPPSVLARCSAVSLGVRQDGLEVVTEKRGLDEAAVRGAGNLIHAREEAF